MFSIVTVCRNSNLTIARTFKSILQQNCEEEFEYIVVDGGSTDGTKEQIQEYENIFTGRGVKFEWLSEPDNGIYDAMNKGIRIASGDIIGIVNSDDYYEEDALTAVSEAAERFPDAGIFYGFLKVIMPNGLELQTYRYRYENYLLNAASGVFSGAQHPTCFVRREVYDQVGVFDLQFPIAADYDFLVRSSKQGVIFHALDKVLSNFCLGGSSDSMNDYERFNQRLGVRKKNGLLSSAEEARIEKQVHYQRCKRIKRFIVRKIFRI